MTSYTLLACIGASFVPGSAAAAQSGSAVPQQPGGTAGIALWLSRAPAPDGTQPRMTVTIPGATIDSAALEDDTDPTTSEIPQLHLDAALDAPGDYQLTVSGAGQYELSYTATPRSGAGVQRLTGQQVLRPGETHRYRVQFDPVDTGKCRLAREAGS